MPVFGSGTDSLMDLLLGQILIWCSQDDLKEVNSFELVAVTYDIIEARSLAKWY
jgi:hypothetical protein